MPPLLHDALIDSVPLSFEQTVPRAWVHKRSLDNVLLTEIRSAAPDRFICAGRIPTAHGFFNDAAGRTPHNDILFYTELGRQASLAMCHAFLDVSPEDVFIFEGSDAAVTEAAWTPGGDAARDSVAIEIRIPDLTRRKNNAVSRVVTEHTMWVGTHRVFDGTAAFTIQPAALFHRLRKATAARARRPPPYRKAGRRKAECRQAGPMPGPLACRARPAPTSRSRPRAGPTVGRSRMRRACSCRSDGRRSRCCGRRTPHGHDGFSGSCCAEQRSFHLSHN